MYEEIEESGLGVTKNTLKVTGDHRVEMKKSGVLTSHMVFEKGKKYVSSYKISVRTNADRDRHEKNRTIILEEEKIRIFVRYTLEAEG